MKSLLRQGLVTLAILILSLVALAQSAWAAAASHSPVTSNQVQSDEETLKAKLIAEAEKHLGTPYEFGAKVGQMNTFDCSSFVKHVFKQIGIELPRVSKDQAKVGRFVSLSQLEVGDLVFFTTPRTGNEIGHVGIYAGNGQFIHTYGEGGVKYTPMDHAYWKSRYVTARRVIQSQ